VLNYQQRVNNNAKNVLIFNDNHDLKKGNKGFWIGLNNLDKESGYQWSDGKPTSFFNWNNGEPNNFNGIEECVEVKSNQGWNDVNCYINKGWICRINKGVIPPTFPIVVQDTFQGKLKIRHKIFFVILYFIPT
jgi:hypothetical protein